MLGLTLIQGLALGAAALCGLGVAVAAQFTVGVVRARSRRPNR